MIDGRSLSPLEQMTPTADKTSAGDRVQDYMEGLAGQKRKETNRGLRWTLTFRSRSSGSRLIRITDTGAVDPDYAGAW